MSKIHFKSIHNRETGELKTIILCVDNDLWEIPLNRKEMKEIKDLVDYTYKESERYVWENTVKVGKLTPLEEVIKRIDRLEKAMCTCTTKPLETCKLHGYK